MLCDVPINPLGGFRGFPPPPFSSLQAECVNNIIVKI